MALFDVVGKAILEIGLEHEFREMHREGLGQRPHPIDRHHLDGAPRAERAGVEFLREPHEMRGFGVEVLAQFLGAAELLILEQDLGADVAERAGQLVVVGVAAGQTVVIDKDLQLALAQRRVVEMRQVVDRGTGGVHRRLIDQMHFAEKLRVAGDRKGQGRQTAKERHARRTMPVKQRQHIAPKVAHRIRLHLVAIPFL